jgi:ABC-type nitrate/sulfonate/bicarbonate transport system permease component
VTVVYVLTGITLGLVLGFLVGIMVSAYWWTQAREPL